jgi:hypothetical protein
VLVVRADLSPNLWRDGAFFRAHNTVVLGICYRASVFTKLWEIYLTHAFPSGPDPSFGHVHLYRSIMSVAQVASNSDQIELWQELTALISHMNPILDKIQEYSREAVPTDLLNEVKKQQVRYGTSMLLKYQIDWAKFAMADLIYLMRTVFDGHMLKDAVLRETEIPYRRMTSVLTTAVSVFNHQPEVVLKAH